MSDSDIIQEALPADCEIGQDYTILRVLGQGGFGITYLAQDNSLGSQVVIKENLPTQLAGRDADTLTIRPRRGEQENYEWARTRFLDEARLLYKLNHPNIVRVTRAFSALNTAYYVMPWVGGTELGQAVKAREDGTSEAYLTALLRQILGALQYLHENNLLHRDIKPENILIAETGEPVLIDFGAARAMVSERSQTMLESPGYTPFEQVQSHGNIGPWTDIYSLGATLYRLITGERPPRSSDRMGEEDPYIPLTARPELNKRYSAAFLQGFDKALEILPKNRWQNAGEWLAALSGEDHLRPNIKRDEPPAQSPVKKKTAKPRNRPRRKTILLILLCFFLTAITATGVLIWMSYPTAPFRTIILKEPPRDFSFSPDNKYLALSMGYRGVSVCEVDSGMTVFKSIPQEEGIDCCKRAVFSPDSRRIAIVTDHAVKVMEICTGKTLCCIDYYDEIYTIAFSPDGKYIATGGSYYIRITEIGTGKIIFGQKVGKDIGATALVYSPDNQLLAVGFTDGKVTLLRLDTKQEIKELWLDDLVRHLAFSPDGKQLIAGTEDGLRVESLKGSTSRKSPVNNDIVALSSNGQHYLSYSRYSSYFFIRFIRTRYTVMETSTGQELWHIVRTDDHYAVAISPDARYIAIDDENINIYKAE